MSTTDIFLDITIRNDGDQMGNTLTTDQNIYLLAIFDRKVFQGAQQMSNYLSLARSSVIDDGEPNDRVLKLFVANLLV